MNYPANNPAIFRRDGTGRALTAGALACTLALLLSTALPTPALADPGSAQLARATPAAARTALPQVSARAAQDRRTCANASGEVAIKACNDAIASGQHRGEALGEIYYNRAIEYSNKGDEQRALADYSEAIRLRPDPHALYNRGNIWASKKDYFRALADYSEAIRLDPQDPDYYHNRGNIWLGRKDYVLAIADFSEVIRLAPDNASAYYNRGTAFTHRGENGRALADLNEAIRLAPDKAGAFNNRGLVWSRQGEEERAIADFSEAIRLAPDQAAAAYYNRGRAWYRLKDYARALADLGEAARLDPTDADTLYARGLARRANGDIRGGEADIAAAKKIDPNVAPPDNASRQI
jgi:tetratricopeptide (TPR) repeat protein